MRNVAFMPKRNIFERCLRVPAQYSGQTTDLLARNRVLLVWHRRRALLLLAEVLLRFPHLGPLQMPDFNRDLVERAADDCQCRDVRSVPVSLNHLRGNRSRLQPETCTNSLFVLWL